MTRSIVKKSALPALLVGLCASTGMAQTFAVSIGVRETGSAAAIGDNGGTANGIEWVNLDGQALVIDNTWQQFTFNFGTAPLTAFAGTTANGTWDGTRGVLEHIRIRNSSGISDTINIWIDDIVNTIGGVNTPVTGFEFSDPFPPVALDTEHMFQEPGFSGSTAANVQTGAAVNRSFLTDANPHSGANSQQINLAFVDSLNTRWVRLTTFAAGQTQPNPTIDFTSTGTPSILSFWLRATFAPPEQRWINPGSGDWDDTNNWGTGVVPNALTAAANFLNDITGPATITLNNPITVNTVRLNSPHGYTIVGGPSNNVLTLDNVAEAPRTINAELGNHSVLAPIQLNFNTGTDCLANFTVARPADLLTISGDITIAHTISGGTLAIQKLGAGKLDITKLQIDNPVDHPTILRVNEGSMRFIAGTGTSRVSALTIAGGLTPTAQLDLRNNSMVIDYLPAPAGPEAEPLDTIKAQIAAGYNGGLWTGNGITSSSAAADGTKALGYGEALAILGVGGGTFGGVAVDDTAVLIKYTWKGDTNLDGQVDITDLGNLATAWQTAGAWGQGDADYSGFIDITDLGALATNWQAGVGNPLGPSLAEALASVGLGGVTVPEPAALVGVAPLLLVRRRNRR